MGDFEEKSSNHYPNGAHTSLHVRDILPLRCAPFTTRNNLNKDTREQYIALQNETLV